MVFSSSFSNGGNLTRSISPRTRNIGCDPEARCKSDAPTSSLRLKNASIFAISSVSSQTQRRAIILRRQMSQLPVGSTAPDFELKDPDGRFYRLSDALKRGPVALVFYKASC